MTPLTFVLSLLTVASLISSSKYPGKGNVIARLTGADCVRLDEIIEEGDLLPIF
jgi:hypothetical protein